MKFVLWIVALTIAASGGQVFAKSEEKTGSKRPLMETCELALGYSLAMQVKPPLEGKPTFLLLPGVNRSTLLSDPAVAALTEDGSGVVTFNFSVQPLSLAEKEPGKYGSFDFVTLKGLSFEVMAVTRKVEKEYGIKNLIPVSLSYSGAVSPYLEAFPTVVDVVPLTSMAAYNPSWERYRQMLKSGEIFNPIFGPGATRLSLDFFYRGEWASQVDSITKQYDLPTDRRSEMIEGYVSLSRAIEGFSWQSTLPKRSVKRVMVLAGHESSDLLTDQIKTIQRLHKEGFEIATVIVSGSGHIIPAEQPAAYATILKGVAADTIKARTVTILYPRDLSSKTIPEAEVETFLEQILEKASRGIKPIYTSN